MVTSRRCRRLITLVPFGSRFEHFDQCKTQRVEFFLSVAGATLDPPLRTAEAVATDVGLSCLRLFVNRCAINVAGSRIYLMRNGKGVKLHLLCFFIAGVTVKVA